MDPTAGVEEVDLAFDIDGGDESTNQGKSEGLLEIPSRPFPTSSSGTNVDDIGYDQNIQSETLPSHVDFSDIKPNEPTDLLRNESTLPNGEAVTQNDPGPPPSTDSPPLANLISAALQNVADKEEHQVLNLSLSSSGSQGSPRMPRESERPGMDIAGEIADFEIKGSPRVLEDGERPDVDIAGGITDFEIKVDACVVSSGVPFSHVPSHEMPTNETSGIAVEINEDIIEPANEELQITTLKQVDKMEDEEFDFEMPAPKPVTFDVTGIKQTMYQLDYSIANRLDTMEPELDPNSTLDAERTATQDVVDATQNYLIELGKLNTQAQEIPSEHHEKSNIKIWLLSTERRLLDLQKSAQLKFLRIQALARQQETKDLVEVSENHESGENGTTRPPISDGRLAAEAEWDNVQTVTPEMQDEDTLFGKRNTPAVVSNVPMINFTEALASILDTCNPTQYRPKIRTSVTRRGLKGFFHKLFGSKLDKSLLEEQQLIFCLAECPYQDDVSCHWHVLQTIYRRLTGDKIDCPRFGGHWELIGFQGNDPSTDLRSCGFLSLLQLLHLVSDPMIFPLTKDMYRLSLHEEQNFPFCLMGINLTRITLQSLREDILNKECNKRKSVIEVVNEYYTALWYQMYMTWKTQHKTIKDTGFVISDLEHSAKKHPHAMISKLNTFIAHCHSGKLSPDTDGDIHFQAVCDL